MHAHSRIKHEPTRKKLMPAREAIKHLNLPKKGQPKKPLQQLRDEALNVGMSGFTSVSYPKIVPTALNDYIEEEELQGDVKYNLFIGASTGPEVDDRMAKNGLISRRYPYQLGKNVQGAVNNGEILFSDQHLSTFPEKLVMGSYTHKTRNAKDKQIDVAIVEATEITEDGYIVPGMSVGASPEILYTADKIIIEINTKLPSCRGLHDITPFQYPGQRKPLNITSASDRIGEEFIRIDPDRVVAVVESNVRDTTSDVPDSDDTSNAIAKNIIHFFQHEIQQGRMPKNLFHLQSGIGSIANQVIGNLREGDFTGVRVYTEVLQDTFLDYFDSGKLDYATSTSIKLSPKGFDKLFDNFDFYKNKIILRNQSVSNSAEVINRIGLIAMNTPVEVDIYGHANSTNVNGSRMISGLGGSNDFLRNAAYSIMHAPSSRPTKTDPYGISTIVFKATHVDQTEHDLQVFVTENGLADLRGLSPIERSREIIDKCAHPVYKDILTDYVNHSITWGKKAKSLHEPHQLDKAYQLHLNLINNGSMRQFEHPHTQVQ